jgi:hypothetical protein
MSESKRIVFRSVNYFRDNVMFSKWFAIVSNAGNLKMVFGTSTVFPKTGNHDALCDAHVSTVDFPSFASWEFMKNFREFEFFVECQKNA